MGKQFIGKFSALAAGIGALALLGAVAPVKAGVINIGSGVGSTDATGLNQAGGPQLIGNTGDVSIYFNGSGSVTSDVLLALLVPMVPNDSTDLYGSTNPLGTITSYANYALYPSGPVTGSSAFVGTGFGLGTGSASYQSNGFWGKYNVLTTVEMSDFLGTNFNDSNNTPNFLGFDASLNPSIPASDYGVYTFDVKPGQSLSGGGIINIAIPGGLPMGSILLAYSDAGDSTVWTNDGGVTGPYFTPVPAGGPLPIPATLPLTTAGGLGLLVLALRKRKTQV